VHDFSTGHREYAENLSIEQARLWHPTCTAWGSNGSGHWLMDEAPAAVMPALMDFVR